MAMPSRPRTVLFAPSAPTTHVAATVATILGLCSFWFAWHTENRAAGWLLTGFVPVSLGVSITTLAVSGIIPFEPWVLMAMPLGSMLEAPFNLFGLSLLERRRAREPSGAGGR